jgi:quercetin dioxygenase-like cupin family protein
MNEILVNKLINEFKNLNELISYSEGGILSKELLKSDKQNVTLFCMSEGTELSEHTSTKEGIVFVLEGKGLFNLEEEKISMQKNVLIFMKKNAVHSIKAEKNISFLLVLTN